MTAGTRVQVITDEMIFVGYGDKGTVVSVDDDSGVYMGNRGFDVLVDLGRGRQRHVSPEGIELIEDDREIEIGDTVVANTNATRAYTAFSKGTKGVVTDSKDWDLMEVLSNGNYQMIYADDLDIVEKGDSTEENTEQPNDTVDIFAKLLREMIDEVITESSEEEEEKEEEEDEEDVTPIKENTRVKVQVDHTRPRGTFRPEAEEHSGKVGTVSVYDGDDSTVRVVLDSGNTTWLHEHDVTPIPEDEITVGTKVKVQRDYIKDRTFLTAYAEKYEGQIAEVIEEDDSDNTLLIAFSSDNQVWIQAHDVVIATEEDVKAVENGFKEGDAVTVYRDGFDDRVGVFYTDYHDGDLLVKIGGLKGFTDVKAEDCSLLRRNDGQAYEPFIDVLEQVLKGDYEENTKVTAVDGYGSEFVYYVYPFGEATYALSEQDPKQPIKSSFAELPASVLHGVATTESNGGN